MLDRKAVEKFMPYLDPRRKNLSWDKQGLVPDAPPEAVEQYREYQEIIAWADKNQIEI